ncbi:hypothetical protein [Cypionkella sp.]|uniref:hypothetical protein n=1 Tax=Cypionkella sp. TaxID=2811411 RepID=UPI003751F360
MTMNPVGRKIDDESQKLIDEFIAKGGKIQHFGYGERTEDISYTAGFYGKRKKQVQSKEENED